MHGSNIIKLIKAFMDSWQIDSLSVCGLMSSLLSTVLFEIFSFGVQLFNDDVLLSGDSVIHILFQIVFPFRLLQSIDQGSLWYTVGPC